MNKTALMVLFGGASSEHEISRASAASLLEHVNREKYDIIKVGITRDGRWIRTEAGPSEIENGAWENHESNQDVYMMPGHGFAGFQVDVVFPLLHGRNGEDGRIQGFLTIMGIPFVGSDSTASAVSMDKAIAKAIIDQAGICRQAACSIVHKGCDIQEATGVITDYFGGEFPLFVKPANAGSSVGISKVKSQKGLPEALSIAFAEDDKVLVEEAIAGREIEVAVIGDGEAASCIGEIFAANEFYDYKSKYDNIGSRTEVVSDLSEETLEYIRSTAEGVYEIMGCSGLARVDFFLTPGESGGYDDGELVFNEINTMPGFTKISMYPVLWEASGLPYSQLIDCLIEQAMGRPGD